MATGDYSPSFRIDTVADYEFYELQPLPSTAKHSRLPSDYDEARLLGSTASDEQLRQIPTRSSKRSKFVDLGKAFTQSDKWKYAKFQTYVAEPASSRNPFRGWRKAVIAAAVVTGFVLLLNVLFLIVVGAKYPPDDGVGVLYTGDCNFVKRWDTALHLLINVLGTCLLAASSFTMQCLVSPTRSEANAAHAKKKSLDVGIPSFYNLWHVDTKKVLLWCGLCFSTVPLHLLWNSTVFSTLGANEISYYVVTEDFLRNATFKEANQTNCESNFQSFDGLMATFQDVQDGYNAGRYSNITVDDFIITYSNPFVTRRNIIAVTTETPGSKMAPGCGFNMVATNTTDGEHDYYPYYYPPPLANGSSILAYNYIGANTDINWLCDGWSSTDRNAAKYPGKCTTASSQLLYNVNNTFYLRPADTSIIDSDDQISYPIDYFLSETFGVETCQLQYVSYILGIVIACNVIKLVCMLLTSYVLWNLEEPIFATVGDAVMSYMETPDETTKGWCLLDHKGLDEWKLRPTTTHDIYKRKSRRRLFAATSTTRWVITVVLCSVYLLIGIILLFLATQDVEGYYDSITDVWKLGLGDINENATLNISGHSTSGLIGSVVFANTFQLALSTTYFMYNALYTAQCGAMEWSTYADSKRKPLRVTWPRGQQRSTYYLHLPYRYGVPLTIFLILMHFFISQSIFLARVQWYNFRGQINEEDYLSDVGFSPIGILVSVCVGAGLIIAQVVHSFRPLDNRIPIHGNSSVVISAMCHTGSGTYENDQGVMFYHPEDNMAIRNVMWGASQQPKDDHYMGHCTFTADAVEMPQQGLRYR